MSSEIESLFTAHTDGNNAHIKVRADQLYLQVSGGVLSIGMNRDSAEALRGVLTVLLQAHAVGGSSIPSPSEEEMREVLVPISRETAESIIEEFSGYRDEAGLNFIKSNDDEVCDLTVGTIRRASQTTRSETELEAASNGMGLR